MIHYAVDNTPAMFPMTVTKVLSNGCVQLMDDVIEGNYTQSLMDAMVIQEGHIRSESIWNFRSERGHRCK